MVQGSRRQHPRAVPAGVARDRGLIPGHRPPAGYRGASASGRGPGRRSPIETIRVVHRREEGPVGKLDRLGLRERCNAAFPIRGTERGIRAGVQRSEIRPELIASASSRSANKHFQSWSRRVAAAVCKSRRHVGLPASIAARSSRVRVPRLSGASRRQPLPRGRPAHRGSRGALEGYERSRQRTTAYTNPS